MSPSLLPVRRALLLCAAAACLAACAAPRHALPVRAEDPRLQDALERRLALRYPPQYRLVQRLALHALGKQYDMVGYLVVSGVDELRAVALGEMGGRIFDLAIAGGEPSILKKPEEMPPRPLLEGVSGDLLHLFLPPRTGLALALGSDGAPALTGAGPGDRAVEYAFDPEGRRLTRSVESEKGRVVREVAYSGYRALAPGAEEVPARITVENRRWHYALEVETLQLIPGAPPPAASAEE